MPFSWSAPAWRPTCSTRKFITSAFTWPFVSRPRSSLAFIERLASPGAVQPLWHQRYSSFPFYIPHYTGVPKFRWPSRDLHQKRFLPFFSFWRYILIVTACHEQKNRSIGMIANLSLSAKSKNKGIGAFGWPAYRVITRRIFERLIANSIFLFCRALAKNVREMKKKCRVVLDEKPV